MDREKGHLMVNYLVLPLVPLKAYPMDEEMENAMVNQLVLMLASLMVYLLLVDLMASLTVLKLVNS